MHCLLVAAIQLKFGDIKTAGPGHHHQLPAAVFRRCRRWLLLAPGSFLLATPLLLPSSVLAEPLRAGVRLWRRPRRHDRVVAGCRGSCGRGVRQNEVKVALVCRLHSHARRQLLPWRLAAGGHHHVRQHLCQAGGVVAPWRHVGSRGDQQTSNRGSNRVRRRAGAHRAGQPRRQVSWRGGHPYLRQLQSLEHRRGVSVVKANTAERGQAHALAVKGPSPCSETQQRPGLCAAQLCPPPAVGCPSGGVSQGPPRLQCRRGAPPLPAAWSAPPRPQHHHRRAPPYRRSRRPGGAAYAGAPCSE